MALYLFKKRVLTQCNAVIDNINQQEFSNNSNEKIVKCTSNAEMKLSTQCEICGKVLSCQSNLIQHARLHSGEKPFSCDICEKRFGRAEHLNIHKRTHTGKMFIYIYMRNINLKSLSNRMYL